jgi:hypothetical protein
LIVASKRYHTACGTETALFAAHCEAATAHLALGDERVGFRQVAQQVFVRVVV